MTLEILANAAVRMSLVGLTAWLVLRALRIRHPHAETLVWRMMLVASLALPALLHWQLAPSFITSLQLPVITATGSGAGGEPAQGASLPMLAKWLLAIYLGGAILLLARLAAGLLVVWRIVRAAGRTAAGEDVRISDRIASPATFGSIILLPVEAASWPSEKLDAVLLHERAHVRGRDSYWSWLAQLHSAVFWFSPLAWFLQRRLESLAEITSDDAVIAAAHDPIDYAALLLDFARHPNSRSVVMSVAESNVPERIDRLLAGTAPSAALSRAARWVAFALMVPAVVFAASTTRAEPPQASVAITKAADPDKYYPAVAKSERVSGHAVVKAILDPAGRLVSVSVVRAEPADPRYGFGEAAMQVARDSQFHNLSQKDATLVFMVKFVLAE